MLQQPKKPGMNRVKNVLNFEKKFSVCGNISCFGIAMRYCISGIFQVSEIAMGQGWDTSNLDSTRCKFQDFKKLRKS